MDKALLEVQNLKTYFFTKRGVVKAVDGVSFEIRERETLGLVGESGCGKTITCLSVLGLVPKPAGKIVEGKIIFDGEDLVQKSEAGMRKVRGRRISIILQDPMTSLNPSFTIGEQVAETIRLHQKAKGSLLLNKVIDSLKSVRIPAAATRLTDYPHQMSGGMRQRVAGAIALSCQPSLLIADEPTTSLDVTTQAQYLGLLKQVQQELNVAMIFITHNLGIVATMCDKVSVMYLGKIVETAKTRELFDNPRHPYTIALLKCIPRLETKVKKLFSIEGQVPSPLYMPKGCSFASRCWKADQRCKQERTPEEVTVGDGHFVSCWHALE